MILKTLLILFLIWFVVFRFFGLLLKPFFSVITNSRNFDQTRRTYTYDSRNTDNSQREGELKIDRVPKKGKKQNKDFNGGEYVDYEELD